MQKSSYIRSLYETYLNNSQYVLERDSRDGGEKYTVQIGHTYLIQRLPIIYRTHKQPNHLEKKQTRLQRKLQSNNKMIHDFYLPEIIRNF